MQTPSTRGGYRPNSGRPTGSGKWGEESTVRVRIPESKAPHIETLVQLPADLLLLIESWEQKYQPGSVRAEVAARCADDLRAILINLI